MYLIGILHIQISTTPKKQLCYLFDPFKEPYEERIVP